eukprot:2967674-Rhodomonas_salina.2
MSGATLRDRTRMRAHVCVIAHTSTERASEREAERLHWGSVLAEGGKRRLDNFNNKWPEMRMEIDERGGEYFDAGALPSYARPTLSP